MKYFSVKHGTFCIGNCLDAMRNFPNNVIDFTLTSPPYDNLRLYKGYSFDFETVAKELFRVTKDGGTLVWIVNDEKINGSESGTSFRQALYFMQCGFKLNDTMIWHKGTFSAVGALKNQYAPVFEYMFVFVKGKQKTFNPLIDRRNKSFGKRINGTIRQKDGTTKFMSTIGNKIAEYGQRFNVWEITPQKTNNGTSHPAVFPLSIAYDHIMSWSNEGDTVFDPFGGSGTTALACEHLDRKWILCEVNEEYAGEAMERILRG